MGDEGANYQYQWKSLHDDVREIKQTLTKLSEAVTKLALVEERQTQQSQALERAFGTLERMEARIASLERSAVSSLRAARWMDRAMIAMIGVTLLYIARSVGLV